MRRRSLLALVLMSAAACVQANDAPEPTTGRVVGEVTSGATFRTITYLANVEVTLTERATGTERKADTNLDGRFAFEDLPPGRYDIRCLHPTHRTFWRDDLIVRVGRTLRLNISLLPDEFPEEEEPTELPPDPSRKLKALELPADE